MKVNLKVGKTKRERERERDEVEEDRVKGVR